MATMGIVVVLALPAIVLTVVAVFGDVAWAGWAALAVGPAIGAGVLVGGVRIGARIYASSAPEVLAKVSAFA